jgi:hypothetical protein
VRRKRPPQVGTIGSTIAGGFKMWISCDVIGCHNSADLDLLALRDQLGDTPRAGVVETHRRRTAFPRVRWTR